MEFLKNKKSQEKVREFCCVIFVFSQTEHPKFENFLEEHAPRLPLTVLETHKNLIVVWKSQGITVDLCLFEQRSQYHELAINIS